MPVSHEDIYTSSHKNLDSCASQGPERITKKILHLDAHLLRNLHRNGIVVLGDYAQDSREEKPVTCTLVHGRGLRQHEQAFGSARIPFGQARTHVGRARSL